MGALEDPIDADCVVIQGLFAAMRASEEKNHDLLEKELETRRLVFQLRHLRDLRGFDLDRLRKKVCRNDGWAFEQEFHLTEEDYVLLFVDCHAAEVVLATLEKQTEGLKETRREIVRELRHRVVTVMLERGKDEIERLFGMSHDEACGFVSKNRV